MALRLNAEKDARRRSALEDISLEDIYQFFPEVNRFDVSPIEMMEAELAEERFCIRPVPAIRERVRKLREQGNRIIFISDMYLPTDFIRKELEKHAFARPLDNIYVSGEIGKTKHTGSLFKFVCLKEGIDPRRLIHTGDNPHTDIKICKKLGIRTTPYCSARQDRWERLVISHTPDRSIEMSRLAGAIRSARLESENLGADPLLAEIAAGVVAPGLTAFTAWVLANAAESNVDRLYFVSRDAKVLLRIAGALGKRRKIPDCRYLYGSRQAWFLPATETVDKSQLAWLIVQGHSRRPRDLVRKLNLTHHDLSDPARSMGLDAGFWNKPLTLYTERLWWELLEQPESVSLIQEKIRTARGLAISYLDQNGLTDLDSVAIVDVGWTLKTQRSLIQLLSHAGWDGRCLGYYLGVAAAAVDTSPIPEYRAFFQEFPRHLDQEHRHNYFFRNANLIEQLFMGNAEGTALGYQRRSGQVEPVLAQRESNPEKIRFFEAIEFAATTFARTCSDSFLDWPKRRLLRFAEAHFEEFICRSGNILAGRVSTFSVKDDQLESRERSLAKPIKILHLLMALLNRIQGFNGAGYNRSFDWIEGSVELSNPIMRGLLKTDTGFELIRAYRKSC